MIIIFYTNYNHSTLYFLYRFIIFSFNIHDHKGRKKNNEILEFLKNQFFFLNIIFISHYFALCRFS
jgi:hypothetical protein